MPRCWPRASPPAVRRERARRSTSSGSASVDMRTSAPFAAPPSIGSSATGISTARPPTSGSASWAACSPPTRPTRSTSTRCGAFSASRLTSTRPCLPVDPAVRGRDQRSDRPGADLRARRPIDRRAACFGVSPAPVPGDRDRRRSVLGRRLSRQSGHLAAHLRLLVARCCARPDQSAGTGGRAPHRHRDRRPVERDQLQRFAHARDAGNRVCPEVDRAGSRSRRTSPPATRTCAFT